MSVAERSVQPKPWGLDCYDVESVRKTFVGNWDRTLIELALVLRNLENSVLDDQTLSANFRELAQRLENNIRDVHQLLRVSLTGKMHGLGTYDIIRIMGVDSACQRILSSVMFFKYPTCPNCHESLEAVRLSSFIDRRSWVNQVMLSLLGPQTEFIPCGCVTDGHWKWADTIGNMREPQGRVA